MNEVTLCWRIIRVIAQLFALLEENMQLQAHILNNFAISRFNEYYLPSINRHTFEGIDSKTLYNRRFRQSFSQQDKLHIVVGMDSGLLANYVLEQDLPLGAKFLFVELDEVMPLLVIDIPADKQSAISIVNEASFIELMEHDEFKIYLIKDEYEIHQSLGVASQHLDAYIALFNRIETKIQDDYFTHRIGFTQKIFFQTQLKNIADNQVPAQILRNTFSGKTCLIIAGGPSLDEHINWIKHNNDNLFIIAVSRIAGKLADNGISVDIITCVDPQDFSFDVSRDMFKLSHKTLLVNSYHVSHKVLSQWNGPKAYLGQRYPWSGKHDHDNIITVGPTVTNSSIRLAIEMGFTTLLLSGVDYCYSKSGYSHAKGTVEASIGPSLGCNNKWVETYAGLPAETPIQLIHAMESLAEEAKTYPDISFINLSINAAKIEGIVHMPTTAIVLSSFTDKSVIEVINEATPDTEDDLNSAIQECSKAISQLETLRQLTKKALTLAKTLNEDPQDSCLTLDKINKIEEEINLHYATLSRLIKTYGYYEFSHFLTSRNTDSWTQSHINEMTLNYYEAFNTICHDILELTKKSYDNLKFRQLELNSTSLTLLAPIWLKKNQSGRIYIWNKYHKHPTLSESDQVIWNELTEQFSQDITLVSPVYVEALNKASTAENIYTKIMTLYAMRNNQGLSITVENLLPFVDGNPELQRLYHLALALQLSLEQQHQQALDALLALPEDLYTEMELKHIILLALKLSKLELAESTLVKILAYSDEYMPQYAHILKLRGKIQESVNVYLDYLEKYPSDTQTWIKLGLFMVELGQAEGAHTAFTNALNVDPSNQVAQHYVAELTRIMTEAQ